MDLPTLAYALRRAEQRYNDVVQEMHLTRTAIREKMIEGGCRTFNYLGNTFYLDKEDELRVMATVQEGDRRYG